MIIKLLTESLTPTSSRVFWHVTFADSNTLLHSFIYLHMQATIKILNLTGLLLLGNIFTHILLMNDWIGRCNILRSYPKFICSA